MTPLLNLVPVQPIGTRRSMAFVDYADGRGGLEEVELPEYPPEHVASGKAFREMRVRIGLGLRHSAGVLGVSVTDLCSLERGAFAISVDDYVQALVLMSNARDAERPPK